MTVTPQVYFTNPGGRQAHHIIAAIQLMINHSPGIHHWEELPNSYFNNGTNEARITLRCLQNSNRLLKLSSTNNTTVDDVGTNFIKGQLSLDGGLTFSFTRKMNGYTKTAGQQNLDIGFDSGQFGIGTSKIFIVELEDAIIISGTKVAGNGGTVLIDDCLAQAIHAGAIFQPQNRNDSLLGIGTEGILSGNPQSWNINTIAGHAWLWYHLVTSAGGFMINRGGVDELTLTIGGISGSGMRLGGSAFLADVDAQRRFVPYPIKSGTLEGHVAYTKYIRAQKTDYDAITNPNGTMYASVGSPSTIQWRHNTSIIATGSVRNSVVIWCGLGQETEVI